MTVIATSLVPRAPRPNLGTEPLLDTSDVARFLGVASNTLEKWRIQGRGPAYHRVGVFIRYRQSDIDAWLAGQRVETEVEALR